ncbi:hypothetical protein [Peribacillus sp. V2I11]|uniref:hypothetical protein n=1 Tax=Peribacillus sp. V2I11 TaxID=3042277 RepID=UPI0027816881|nr:hypothetical protein [Peribacillus sp. V2I11]MDQ0879080.1 hypothetical protein [Peribacillus sp. V2I11]
MVRRLANFVNDKYPKITSLLDLKKERTSLQWINYLNNSGIRTRRIITQKDTGMTYEQNTPIANFFSMMYEDLLRYSDMREEWEKDKWDIRNLKTKYGLLYNESKANYYLDFSVIKNVTIRNAFKEYCKLRLLSRNNFTVSTALDYLRYIRRFANFINMIEPEWDDFKHLKRKHIIKYLEFMNDYATSVVNQSRKAYQTSC